MFKICLRYVYCMFNNNYVKVIINVVIIRVINKVIRKNIYVKNLVRARTCEG